MIKNAALCTSFILFLSCCLSAEDVTSSPVNGRKIFIENGISCYRGTQSNFIFISPEETSNIKRTVEHSKTCLETVGDSESKYQRYCIDSGFVLYRLSDDNVSCYSWDSQKIMNDINRRLNYDGNQYDVYHYDYKDHFSFSSPFDVFTWGSIFSSKRDGDHGYFFVKKYKEKDTGYACFLIYYDYLNDFEAAKSHFNKLVDCIYTISDGHIEKYVPDTPN